jgi:hypothetical protein
MTGRRSAASGEQPNHHTCSTAVAAVAGEDDTWQINQILGADDLQNSFDSGEAEDGEERRT